MEHSVASLRTDATAQAIPQPNSTAKAANAVGDEEGQFPEFVHQYLRDYIALADQKAAFLFAVVAAIIAYLVEQKAPLAPITSGTWTWVGVLGLLAMAVLGITAGFVIATVVPRLKRGLRSKPGLIFWEDIAAHPSADDYAAVIRQMSKSQTSDQVRAHCYVLAQIARHKYDHLNRGIITGIVGFVLAVLFTTLA